MLAVLGGGRMHHGWIFAGPQGVGKAGFALKLARRMLADAAGPAVLAPGLETPEDHRIATLLDAGSHPDFALLQRLEKDNGDRARNIGVDQIRGLQRLLGNAPSMSSRRVIVIDSADDLERSAANALLKNLEEPPADTFFLLVSHAPSRLLPTIRSRCRMLRFPALPDEAVEVAVRREKPDITAEELRALVEAASGSPGKALSYAGLKLAAIDASLRKIAQTGDPDNSLRIALARELAGRAARPRYEAFLELAPSFAARLAKDMPTAAQPQAVHAWEAIRNLAGGALILALDPSAVVFDIGSQLATLVQVQGEPQLL